MAGSRRTEAAVPAVISRREAIVGALALAAGTLIATKPEAARAADGDALLLGRTTACSGLTWIRNTTTGGADGDVRCEAFLVSQIGPGYYAFYGHADESAGANSGGVLGEALGTGQYGVWASNDAVGGIGLRTYAPNGTALQVIGPATFSRSGRGSIAKGHASVTVTGLTGLGTDALILVTLQGSAGSGVYLRYAKRLADTKFQVVLNKAASAKVYFAWMILN
jgi:hypothetical protein